MPRALRDRQRFARVRPAGFEPPEQVEGGASGYRRGFDRLSDVEGQPGDPRPGELDHAVGERAVEFVARADAAERARQLQRVEGVAAGQLRDPDEPRPRRRPAELPAQDAGQFARADRGQVKRVETPIGRQP